MATLKKSYPWGMATEEYTINKMYVRFDPKTKENTLVVETPQCTYEIPMDAKLLDLA